MLPTLCFQLWVSHLEQHVCACVVCVLLLFYPRAICRVEEGRTSATNRDCLGTIMLKCTREQAPVSLRNAFNIERNSRVRRDYSDRYRLERIL